MATRREAIGVKVPPDWKTSIQAIAQQQGITPSQWLYGLIADALEGSSESSSNPTVNRVNPLEEKLNAIEHAIASLNVRLTELTHTLEQIQPSKPAERVNPHTPAATPTPSPRPLPSPSSGEWLRLPEAFELAQARGYSGKTVDAFRGWVKRNAPQLAQQFGLEWHGANSKNAMQPTYKDLWFGREDHKNS